MSTFLPMMLVGAALTPHRPRLAERLGPRSLIVGGLLLLDSIPGHRAGVASGVFNTSRQVGGALAVAVFGALLANRAMFLPGLRVSLLLAGSVTLAAAAATLLLKPSTPR